VACGHGLREPWPASSKQRCEAYERSLATGPSSSWGFDGDFNGDFNGDLMVISWNLMGFNGI